MGSSCPQSGETRGIFAAPRPRLKLTREHRSFKSAADPDYSGWHRRESIMRAVALRAKMGPRKSVCFGVNFFPAFIVRMGEPRRCRSRTMDMTAITQQKAIDSLRWAKAKLTRTSLDIDLKRAKQIAKLLDAQFEVAGVKFGLEAFLGLVPVVGDTVGALAGLYPIWVANRHKLGKAVQAKMAANLAVEWGGGLIPWVGDFFDVAFKANLRNVKLLEEEIERRRDRTVLE